MPFVFQSDLSQVIDEYVSQGRVDSVLPILYPYGLELEQCVRTRVNKLMLGQNKMQNLLDSAKQGKWA